MHVTQVSGDTCAVSMLSACGRGVHMLIRCSVVCAHVPDGIHLQRAIPLVHRVVPAANGNMRLIQQTQPVKDSFP
jgi:hypothetical protein